MSENIAFVYVAKKNPDGRALAGVPLRDITIEEFAAFPVHVQRSIAAQAMYQEPKPKKETKPEPDLSQPAEDS